jgi:hypothetical protein
LHGLEQGSQRGARGRTCAIFQIFVRPSGTLLLSKSKKNHEKKILVKFLVN